MRLFATKRNGVQTSPRPCSTAHYSDFMFSSKVQREHSLRHLIILFDGFSQQLFFVIEIETNVLACLIAFPRIHCFNETVI